MYVSLSISPTGLKALLLQGTRVKSWFTRPLPAGILEAGFITQPEVVGKEIDTLFRETKLPRDKVITVVAGLPFVYRFLTLPRLKPSLMEEAIFRAMAREITIPVEELSLSWKTISEDKGEVRLFVLGVPYKAVDVVKQTLKAARVTPFLMGIRPLALARVANRANAIVVNIEPDGYDIAFVADGIPQVLHSMEPAGPDATLEDNIHRLSGEILKMEDYYRSSLVTTGSKSETPILVTGEYSEQGETLELLQAETDNPVMLLQFPVQTIPGFAAGTFGMNVGLALKKTPLKTAKGETVPFHDININVFSGRRQPMKKKPGQGIPASIALLLGLAVIFVISLFVMTRTLATENENLSIYLRNLNRDLGLALLDIQQQTEQEKLINSLSLEAEKANTVIDTLLNSRLEIPQILDIVTRNLTAGIQNDSVYVGDNEVTIFGKADNKMQVVPLSEKLEASGEFSSVQISEIIPVPGSETAVSFKMTLTW